jgi:hypothetical protein
VYSLSSANAEGKTTLNMITYASPIALRPQRKYALGLYVQSMTYQNVKETGKAVLQVGRTACAGLAQPLQQCWLCLSDTLCTGSASYSYATNTKPFDGIWLATWHSLISLGCLLCFPATQILQQPHAQLTQLLGKTSGRDVDKVAQLQQLGYAVSEEYGLPVLAGEWPDGCKLSTARSSWVS